MEYYYSTTFPTYSQRFILQNMGWELSHKQVFPEHLITEECMMLGKVKYTIESLSFLVLQMSWGGENDCIKR